MRQVPDLRGRPGTHRAPVHGLGAAARDEHHGVGGPEVQLEVLLAKRLDDRLEGRARRRRKAPEFRVGVVPEVDDDAPARGNARRDALPARSIVVARRRVFANKAIDSEGFMMARVVQAMSGNKRGSTSAEETVNSAS